MKCMLIKMKITGAMQISLTIAKMQIAQIYGHMRMLWGIGHRNYDTIKTIL